MTNLREAAQMALDALEYLGPSWPDARQKAAEALRAALTQPEQEQMAQFKFQNYGWWRDEDGKLKLGTMPQREWQGLTDEEIREFEIWLDDEEEKHGWNPPADIVKYIEAKLKEKNHG